MKKYKTFIRNFTSLSESRSSGQPRVSHLCDIEYDNNEFIIE